MVEEINLTVNRSMDFYTYKLPFCNVNITLEGSKTEPEPEIQGNLPFTKRVVGNELLDFGEWLSGGQSINGQLNAIRIKNGIISRYSKSVPICHVTGEGLANYTLQIKSNDLMIYMEEYYWNLFWEEPTSTLEISKVKDNFSKDVIRFIDIIWTTTRPQYDEFLGYDKSTDTLYCSHLALNRNCEYYSDRRISSSHLYTAANEVTFDNVYETVIIGASNLIPALKNIE